MDTSPTADNQKQLDAELLDVVAAKQVDKPRFQALLDAGANPNIRTDKGQPILHRLTMKGDVESIHSLVAAGADIHARDDRGNGVLACSFIEDTLLALLKLGASPSVRNDSGRSPVEELPLYMGRHGYNALIEDSVKLLKNCTEIEKSAEAGTLSAQTWEDLCPEKPSFQSNQKPQHASLVYLLHKMEQADTFLPKSLLQGDTAGAEALRNAIISGETTAVAWRDHCDANNKPMSAANWRDNGFHNLAKEGQVACLFTDDYWANKDSLQNMTELFNALPEQARNDLHPRLAETIGKTLGAWAHGGGGKDMGSDELRSFHRNLPDQMRPLFRGFHSQLVARQQNETTMQRGR